MNNFSKNIFYITLLLILFINITFLFYYAYLIPLNVDEAGYWFNFTNKSFWNRSVPIDQIPNHTLPIYLAKLSLFWFGHTGIGLRFPAIIFGVFDTILIFIWIRHVTDCSSKGLIGACFLLLLPWFAHYSHELRGYSAYIFFSLVGIFAFRFLLLVGDKIR